MGDMAWDSSRPVPWLRLAREWVIYALVMTAVVLLFFDPGRRGGMIAGVLISGPLYLAFGGMLAKFGYQRKTIGQMRNERPAPRTKKRTDEPAAAGPRPKPPPTRRTSTGPNRQRKSRR